MRYKMIFSYDGTNFYGYQKQPHKRTVQKEIENCLTKINGNKKVIINSSGRTDSKVHALNQTAHFDLEKEHIPENLAHSLNRMMPKDIYIKKIELVSNTFHARFDIKKKEYIYKLNIGEYSPLEYNYIYQYNQNLDIDKMNSALQIIKGEHDFTSFTKGNEDKETFIRTIFEVDIHVQKNIVTIRLVGNGFLRYMVRNIVGLLIEIGSGEKDVDEMKVVLEKKDRKEAGITAPPQGLYLKKVEY